MIDDHDQGEGVPRDRDGEREPPAFDRAVVEDLDADACEERGHERAGVSRNAASRRASRAG